MKRIVQAAAWLACILLLALSPFLAALLPLSREELVQRSFASWSGVLRIWKCEGWQSGAGSMNRWLNAGIEVFEKRNQGVYVQITDVSSEVMRKFTAVGTNPPDAVLFAPGMLESPQGLAVLEGNIP